MKFNVGTIDRIIRGLIGIILIGLAIAGVIGAWGWLGLIPLLSAAFSFCPLYAMLGITTKK